MKIRVRAAAVAASLSFVASSGFASAAPSTFPSAALTAEAQRFFDAQHAPSAVVAISIGGHVVYVKAFGLRDVALRIPADAGTHYEIGSMTKQFTAAAIMQLREAGKLSIDDLVAKYLPDAPHAKQLTIRNLLSHRSGLFDYTNTSHFETIASTKPGSYDAMMAMVKGKPLAFKPGSKFDYSNTNYIILGRIVEVVSGVPYERYVHDNEFVPANMTSSTFIAHESTIGDMAIGYHIKDGTAQPAPVLIDRWAWSAGDIVSTVADMLRWNRALTSGEIVTPQDFAVMTATTPATATEDPASYYGFGLGIDTVAGQPQISHTGGTFGFRSYGGYFPNQQMRVIALTNGDAVAPEFLAGTILKLTYPKVVAAFYAPRPGEDPALTARFKTFLTSVFGGKADRSQLTPAMNKRLTPAHVAILDQELAALGAIQSLSYRGKTAATNGTSYQYIVRFQRGDLNAAFLLDVSGKIAKLSFSL